MGRGDYIDPIIKEVFRILREQKEDPDYKEHTLKMKYDSFYREAYEKAQRERIEREVRSELESDMRSAAEDVGGNLEGRAYCRGCRKFVDESKFSPDGKECKDCEDDYDD